MNLVEQLFEEVSRFYSLLDVYKIPIQPTDLALFQTLSPTLRQLKESVDMATDTKDENITKFSAELEKAMGDLMSEVSEIRNKAQDPMVLNSGAKSELVIKFLEDLRTQLDKVDELKCKYESWGELFKNGGTPTAPAKAEPGKQAAKEPPKTTDLEETRTEVDLKRTLWTSLKEWDALTE
jgi:dynein heavy chain